MPDIVNYISIVPPRAANGLIGEVYEQSKREIGRLVEAVTMFSPDPALLAASWGAFREPLLAQGLASRVAKEAVAASVSQLNRCPYCVDAHTIMLYGGGAGEFAGQLLDGGLTDAAEGPYQELARWARNTGTAATAPGRAPFPIEQVPEYLGVLVYFHFLNRVINVLLEDTFLPGSDRAKQIARRVAGRAMARKVTATNAPGRAAGQAAVPQPLPADLDWALGSPDVATAFAGLAAAIEQAAAPALSPQVQDLVRGVVDDWRGETPGPSTAWVDGPLAGLAPADRPAGRLALLTALAPYQVSEGDVAAYRAGHPGDQHLLGLLTWSAFTAARRVGAWTVQAVRDSAA